MALSKDQVVDTAVDVLRRYGLGDLTMRRLARELGVQPGALYWHVASKQELLVDVAARLLEDLPAPGHAVRRHGADASVHEAGGTRGDGGTREAGEALAAHARALREAVRHVPDGADVVALAHAVDPGSLPALAHLVTLVGRAGVPASERAAVADLVLHHVLGSVTTEHNRRTALAVDVVGGREDDAARHAFDTGLAVVLAGLGSR